LETLCTPPEIGSYAGKDKSIGDLIYFNWRARAEPLKMMMAYAKIKYNNRLVSDEEWPKLKPTMPEGAWIEHFYKPDDWVGEKQLPVLKLADGTMLPDSRHIAKYIAMAAGAPLWPDTEYQQKSAADLFRIGQEQPLLFMHQVVNMFPADECKPHIPPGVCTAVHLLHSMDRRMRDGPFFGGEEPHYGDFSIFHIVDLVNTLDPTWKMQGFPGWDDEDGKGRGFHATWIRWYDKMANLPGVKEYLAERPKAKYQGDAETPCIGKKGSLINARPLDDPKYNYIHKFGPPPQQKLPDYGAMLAESQEAQQKEELAEREAKEKKWQEDRLARLKRKEEYEAEQKKTEE